MDDEVSLRVNPQLKEDFYKFCKSRGFAIGKAIKLFARQFSKSGKLPFSLSTQRSYSDDNIMRICIRITAEAKQEFSEACEKYGLPMSMIIRGFMDYCVTNDCFPYEGED